MIILLLIAEGVMIALYGLLAAVVTFLAYILGIFGWAQIVGSIQQYHNRGPKASWGTILIWAIILGGATAIVGFLLRQYLVAYLVGLGVSLVQILFAGEIK